MFWVSVFIFPVFLVSGRCFGRLGLFAVGGCFGRLAGVVGVFGAWLAGVLGAEWTVFSVLGGSERMSLCGSIPAVTAARGSCPKIYAQRTACALAAFG